MKRKFKLTFEDRVMYTEINLESGLSFGVNEAKKWLKEKYPTVKKIEHVKQ